MPYLTLDRRMELDHGRKPNSAGELTYRIQQQLNDYLIARGEALCFADLANCLGALEAAKIDFTEHVLLDYEYGKRRENGDVWDETVLKRVQP